MGGVILDTNVWIAYFHGANGPLCDEVDRLSEVGRVAPAPPVRFEILRGIPVRARADSVRGRLDKFPQLETRAADWDAAADYARRVAATRGKHRVQLPDLLIAALAVRLNAAVWSADPDFEDRIAPHVPRLRRYRPPT